MAALHESIQLPTGSISILRKTMVWHLVWRFSEKLFLTTFRIIAVALIGWYLYKIVKRGFKTGYIVCVSLILTGALGNIIDSVFYGVLFNESTLKYH